MKKRSPDEKPEENQDDSEASIDACAQDLIDAVHAKDVKAASSAIKSAFEILKSETESIEPHSYEASKEE